MNASEPETNSPETIDSRLEDLETQVLFSCPIVSNVIPKRGIWWHIIFSLIFISLSSLLIYLREWAFLFFLVITAGYSLWRGHDGKEMTLQVDGQGVKINQRRLLYQNIDNYFFGTFGQHKIINFVLTKKYLPKASFLFVNNEDAEQLRKYLQDRVPEAEEAEEGWVDFIARKLKI